MNLYSWPSCVHGHSLIRKVCCTALLSGDACDIIPCKWLTTLTIIVAWDPGGRWEVLHDMTLLQICTIAVTIYVGEFESSNFLSFKRIYVFQENKMPWVPVWWIFNMSPLLVLCNKQVMVLAKNYLNAHYLGLLRLQVASLSLKE